MLKITLSMSGGTKTRMWLKFPKMGFIFTGQDLKLTQRGNGNYAELGNVK